MNMTSIVEDTKRARFCSLTGGWTDRQTDGQGETSIPLQYPFNSNEAGVEVGVAVGVGVVVGGMTKI